MGIGSGIFIFVVGAILAFAINVNVSWVDLNLVGYLLMGAGIVVFLVSLVFVFRRRGSSSTIRTLTDPDRGERITERDTNRDV